MKLLIAKYRQTKKQGMVATGFIVKAACGCLGAISESAYLNYIFTGLEGFR